MTAVADDKNMNAVQYSVEPLLRVAQTFAATPRVMAELGHLLRDPNVELKEVSALLKRDNALASRLLRIANSAAFGQSEHVASIDDAAALIGFREIHRLVGAVAVDQFSSANFPLYGFAGRRLRENALLVALLMEELAKPADQNPPSAYTIGLFRPLGKLTLEKLAAEFKPVSPFQPERDLDLVLWEKHAFGISANDATALILKSWHFPPEIPNTIMAHFTPLGSNQPLVHLLNFAASLAEKLGYGLPGEKRYWVESQDVYSVSGVNPAAVKAYVDRALSAFARLNRAIG